MNPYMKKEEILSEYYMLVDAMHHSEPRWELLFLEGGRRVTVFEYSSWQEADSLWDNDALFHWSYVLHRTWDDEDFKS